MREPTFSETLKEELSNLELEGFEEIKAELSGFLKARGSHRITSNMMVVALSSISASRRFIRLVDALKREFNREISISTRRLDKRKRIEIAVSIDPFVDLRWRRDPSPSDIPEYITLDPELIGCFVRGMFMAGGSMANPRKHYHFEIVTFSEELLENVQKALSNLFGISGNVVKLRYSYRLYYKSSRDILELLNLMGAIETASKLERIMREKEAKSDVNRTYNFISANAVRSGTSIAKQIEAIRKIDKTVGLERLPEDLRRIARLRLENEDLSLRELGEILDPPMTKTMVYNRLKKIMKIAEELGE